MGEFLRAARGAPRDARARRAAGRPRRWPRRRASRAATLALRVVISGAAPLDADTAERAGERLGAPVRQGYGMTEASPVTHMRRHDQASPDQDPGAIGALVPGTEGAARRSRDGRGRATASGELWIRGPQVMRGYLGDDAATAATLVDDGWLHTGDVARVDDDGVFRIVDRRQGADQVQGLPGAARPSSRRCCSTIPTVADAAVIPVPDEAGGEVPKACVVAARRRPRRRRADGLGGRARRAVQAGPRGRVRRRDPEVGRRQDPPPAAARPRARLSTAMSPPGAAGLDLRREPDPQGGSTVSTDRLQLVRDSYTAYETEDRDLIERVIADDFVFSAPPDVGIDRATYFERCWPNAGHVGRSTSCGCARPATRSSSPTRARARTGRGSATRRSSGSPGTGSRASRSTSAGTSTEPLAAAGAAVAVIDEPGILKGACLRPTSSNGRTSGRAGASGHRRGRDRAASPRAPGESSTRSPRGASRGCQCRSPSGTAACCAPPIPTHRVIIRERSALAHLLRAPGQVGLGRAWVTARSTSTATSRRCSSRAALRGLELSRRDRAQIAVEALRIAGPRVLRRPPVPAVEARTRRAAALARPRPRRDPATTTTSRTTSTSWCSARAWSTRARTSRTAARHARGRAGAQARTDLPQAPARSRASGCSTSAAAGARSSCTPPSTTACAASA